MIYAWRNNRHIPVLLGKASPDAPLICERPVIPDFSG